MALRVAEFSGFVFVRGSSQRWLAGGGLPDHAPGWVARHSACPVSRVGVFAFTVGVEYSRAGLLCFGQVVAGVFDLGFIGRDLLSRRDDAVEPRDHAFQLRAEAVDYLVLTCKLRDCEGDRE